MSVPYSDYSRNLKQSLIFAAAGTVLVSLLLGLTVSTWLYLSEQDARRRAVDAEGEQTLLREQAETHAERAKAEAVKSSQVAAFMKDMLKGVDPSIALGRDTKMLREILDRTAERLDKLNATPEVEAELRGTLGFVYRELGENSAAEAMHHRALAIRERLFGRKSLPVAESLSDLAESLRDQNEAEALQREALSIRRELLGNTHYLVGLSLYRTGMTLNRRDRGADAEPLLRKAVVLLERTGDDHRQSPRVQLALALTYQRKFPEAEEQFREAMSTLRKKSVGPDPQFGDTLHNLAFMLRNQGRLAEAELLFREALEVRRKIYSRRHPTLLVTLIVFSACLRMQGKLEEADKFASEVIALSQEPLVERKVLQLAGSAYSVVASVRRDQGRLEEAEAALSRSVTMGEQFGSENWWLVFPRRCLLGEWQLEQKKVTHAEATFLAAFEDARRHEKDSPARAAAFCKEAAQRLVRVYELSGQLDKAARWREVADPKAGK